MSGGLVVSTLGGWYHNVQEFPGMSLWAPEMLMTIVPALVLVIWWWARPSPTLIVVTAVWVLLSLVVGAVLSVFPLSVLPFEPEQTAEHYQSHLVYAVTQIPLLVVLSWLGGRVRSV